MMQILVYITSPKAKDENRKESSRCDLSTQPCEESPSDAPCYLSKGRMVLSTETAR